MSAEDKVINLHSAKRISLMTPGTTTPIPPCLANASLRIALTAFCLGSLAGFTLPRAISVFAVDPLKPYQKISSGWYVSKIWKEISSQQQDGTPVWQIPQLHFYLLAWSVFHLMEFVITARWNNTRLYSDSFLIQNGLGYHLAHIFGIVEFIIEAHFFPHFKIVSIWTGLGIAVLILGQLARSLAMIQAGNNFSHQVAEHKRDDHQLVTKGLYAYMRHPSYFGFYYWALGTQIVLCNPIGSVTFAFVLWRFFNNRIKGEEQHLIKFFGDQYVQYRKTTRTLIPFIT